MPAGPAGGDVAEPAQRNGGQQPPEEGDGHRSNQVPLTPGRALRQPHAHRGAAPEGQSSRKRKNPDAPDAELAAAWVRVSYLEKEMEGLLKSAESRSMKWGTISQSSVGAACTKRASFTRFGGSGPETRNGGIASVVTGVSRNTNRRCNQISRPFGAVCVQ